MVLALSDPRTVERPSPESHGRDADLDDPHGRSRERAERPLFEKYVDALRARVAADSDNDRAQSALAFIEQCEAARARCLRGACRRADFHFKGCIASGKSRPHFLGASARSRSQAVDA